MFCFSLMNMQCSLLFVFWVPLLMKHLGQTTLLWYLCISNNKTEFFDQFLRWGYQANCLLSWFLPWLHASLPLQQLRMQNIETGMESCCPCSMSSNSPTTSVKVPPTQGMELATLHKSVQILEEQLGQVVRKDLESVVHVSILQLQAPTK